MRLTLFASAVVAALVLVAPVLSAQAGALVRGTVLASDNGEPVVGATVVVAGSRVGTVTSETGQFTLRPRTANDTLVISRIGFQEQRVALAGRNAIEVKLTRTAVALSGVVVVGYGTQKRSDITGSVASVPMERLQDKPNVDLVQSLQGALPGVTVVNSGAGAEPSLSITVRGQRSISASSSPLVVVDGIPYNGTIAEINPGDIASLEVLKDASATAIYGARGSNGVLLVTTRKGTAGKARVTYSGSTGAQNFVELPRTMTAVEFKDFKCTRLRTTPTQACDALFTATETANIADNIDTPWQQLGTKAASINKLYS